MQRIGHGLMGLAALVFLGVTSIGISKAQDLRVGAGKNVGGMIVFVAQGKGIFAKHGLNTKVVVRKTGAALTKSLAAGEIDFAPAYVY